jgi:hypothetical protein
MSATVSATMEKAGARATISTDISISAIPGKRRSVPQAKPGGRQAPAPDDLIGSFSAFSGEVVAENAPKKNRQIT